MYSYMAMDTVVTGLRLHSNIVDALVCKVKLCAELLVTEET